MMIENRQIIFTLHNVGKIYQGGEIPFHALKNVQLKIFEGEFVVILGPSGSGKTTLLNILGGIDSPSEGEWFYRQKNLSSANDFDLTTYRRHVVGFIFQFYNLLPTLTARENIEVATAIAQNPMDALSSLGLVDLSDRANHFPAQLSGGEQQRVAIARALAKNPDVLLCDEPTGALDSRSGKKVLEILVSICKKMNKNVIMITHNHELSKIADRIIYIKDGQIERDEKQPNPIPVAELNL